MADVTLSAATLELRDWFLHGGGDVAGVTAFLKAHSGDIQLEVVVPDTTPAPTTDAWSQTMTVRLQTADGEVHTWYNGPVTLAIADTGGGTATIVPAAGAHNMVGGELDVVVAGEANTWANGEAVTLTASIGDQDSSGDTDKAILGYAIADHTGVITFTT